MGSANEVGSQPARLFPGLLIAGRYRLGLRLGSGGEGDAFAAVDETTGATRALKVFRNPNPTSERRARAEFERLVGMEHPGVVRALDLGRADGCLFLVAELITGTSIAAIAEVGDDAHRLSLFARAAREVTDALAYLHGRGVVHGDVSPDNVRLATDGHAILIDLGASGLASTGGAIGTLGFAAPEALVGRIGPSTDLFALGATLFAAWTGTGPFGVGASSVARMLAGPAPPISTVRAGLPDGWARLIDRLLQTHPLRRPASARAVLRDVLRLLPGDPGEAIDLVVPFSAGDPLAGIFVGRAREREILKATLDRLADGASPHAVIGVVGTDGSGRSTLIDIALQDLAISQVAESSPPLTVFRGSLPALTAWLAADGTSLPKAGAWEDSGAATFGERDAAREQQWRFAAVASALETRACKDPICAVLDPGVDECSFASFVAGAPPSGRLLIVLAAAKAFGRIGALDLTLDPLSADDVHLLASRAAGEEPPAPAIARVVKAGAGHAGTIALLVRQLVAAIRAGEADRFAPALDAALDGLLVGSWAGLPTPARRLVAATALGLPARGPGGDRGGVNAAQDAARAAGWLTGDAAYPRLPSSLHESVLRRSLATEDLQGIVREALSVLPDDDARRGVCLEAAGQIEPAAISFQAAAHRVRTTASSSAPAAALLAEAFRLAPTILDVPDRLFLADDLALQGRAEAALAVLISSDRTSGPSVTPLDRVRLMERRAWILGRTGDLEGARRVLEQALADTSTTTPHEGVALLRARLARVLVSMGLYNDAIAAADPLLGKSSAQSLDQTSDQSSGQFWDRLRVPDLAVESALLARAYSGDLLGARRLHTELGARALSPVRASYIGALLDQLAGELEPALDGYRRSLREAEGSGDIHTLAAIALNMGALAAEAGRYQESLATQDRAIRELGRLGATAELGMALFNAGMLLIEVGDLPGARRALVRMRTEVVARAATPVTTVMFLEGELALREGNPVVALDLFTRVALAPGPDAGVRRAADLGRVELLADQQRSGEAAAIIAAIERRDIEGAAGQDARMAADLRLVRARVVLASPVLDVDAALRLAPSIQADADAAARAGRRPRAWRGALIAARIFHRAGQPTPAAQALGTARRLFEEIRMSTPIDHRPGLAEDKDAHILVGLAGQGAPGEQDVGEDRSALSRSSRSEGRLRRLLRINKRLNSELRLPRLLELIMDTVIELTEAERGFILLEDDKGDLEVKIARNIDQESLETGAFEWSRSIARQAATGGLPIVTVDAAGDPRFREALSVSDLHLRSVLAVPLQIKGRAVGTLYVDNRLRKGAFGDDDVQLVLDFAEQAAIAIENARLLSELRKRERQIEVLNRRLTGELAARKEELSGMKQELRENREALAIRYDYRNIVGRTPRMLELFRLLDRLTDTILPVVIQGESGTGKELVARALHFNGPRKDRPFVSENCAAIPETLLESTLFGAVRGAYTGADHDTRGLFEVADGGTLFLDEVGEMSPGMQGKLLRVLQTGELRRVGSERIRIVDVRIIAATNRDLGRMVEEGRFRQDLFFRLSVARIALPPLRDRRDDIPAIVEHVLGKVAAKAAAGAIGKGGAPLASKRVNAAAMARLGAYRWPGNVRELENEIMRALALCGDQITVSDLSPHVAGESEAALTTLEDPDDLSLRPRVERLERALLREALSRSGGNQTRAAEQLGLSRFGLQKKLRRYKIA